MKRELTPQEVVYNVDFISYDKSNEKDLIPQYNEIYKNIDIALNIDKEGYNLYLIDTFSKDKLDNIINYVENILKKRDKPKDICYVTDKDPRCPKPMFLKNGLGNEFKEYVESLKVYYLDKIFEFYNSSSNREKEEIIDDVQKKRNTYIGGLIDMAKKEGFDLKATTSGFAFIPLKDEGEAMTEREYDDLGFDHKDDIVNRAGKLKTGAEDVLEKLRDVELDSIEKLKEIYEIYLKGESKEIKEEIDTLFEDTVDAKEYLKDMCRSIEREIVDIYSMTFEDDEEKIGEIINRYNVNVLVDNTGYVHPRAIFEEDPSIGNLMGSIEYESHNGTYSTDVSLINAGSYLKANEGCIIIRASSLIENAGSYYCLRKSLMSHKMTFDFNKGYLELISLNGLKPEPINTNVKVIIIGDYKTFDILYYYEEDFKKIFKVKAEYNAYVDADNKLKGSLYNLIINTINKNKLLKISDSGINELCKFLSRKAGSRNKVLVDDFEIDRILNLANNSALLNNESVISDDIVREIAYHEELIQKEILDNFKSNKIIIDVKSKIVGSINGLCVLDTGYYSFGRPMRITCVCTKGSGRIVDVQKESNMSGNIHIKSLNIIRALMSKITNPYKKLPIDFYLSFEQTYGMLEGDSASVAQTICMISAMSKIPVKQNIAVTGSLNQFGEVQPIGGVNEKIEGFFNVCKAMDTVEGKGVLIPYSNKDEIVLNSEVEDAVVRGEFKIYTMSNINDAIEVLLLDEGKLLEDALGVIENEISMYEDKDDAKDKKQ